MIEIRHVFHWKSFKMQKQNVTKRKATEIDLPSVRYSPCSVIGFFLSRLSIYVIDENNGNRTGEETSKDHKSLEEKQLLDF